MRDTLVLSAGHQLRDQAAALADAAVACEFGRYPALRARYGPAGRAKSRQDAACHWAHLADALDFDSPALFKDYVGWAKVLLEQRGVRGEDLEHHLACMAEVVRARMPAPVAGPAAAMIEAALAELPALPGSAAGVLDAGQPLSALARAYVHALLGGYRGAAARLVLEAADRGEPLPELYLQVFRPALQEIGRLWQMNKINVAQEHFCSAATQLAMSQLLARAAPAEPCGRGVMVVCVSGDLHDLGARMVADFFEMAGWNTYFCGANTPHAAVVHTAVERAVDVLAVSASMCCFVHKVRELVDAVRADPRCGRLRVIVGGYPFALDPALAPKVGADGTAADAGGAVVLARQALAGTGPAA